MNEALSHGADIEAAFWEQAAISHAARNPSRAHGAMLFLTHRLELRDATGLAPVVIGVNAPKEVAAAIYRSGCQRRSALALLPKRVESEAVRWLCRLVSDFHKAHPQSVPSIPAAELYPYRTA